MPNSTDCGRNEKTLTFDPSFTTFDFDEPRYKRYRRGHLARTAPPTDANAMWKDLLLYYPLDEVSETVRDAGPHHRHGKASMTAVVFYGRKKNAYLFNGKSSLIRIDSAGDVNACDALSISVWINVPRDVRDATVFRWPATGEYGGTYLAISRGRLRYRFGSGRSETGQDLSATYTAGTWHHVVMTHDRAGANAVYVDGKVVDSRPSVALQNNDVHLFIGCRSGESPLDRPFRGLIDELMVFKRALSPTEIKTLAGCPAPPAASTATSQSE